MANKPINMKKLKALLRLYINGHSKRFIAKSCGLSKNTVKKYIQTFHRLNIDEQSVEELTEKALCNLFIEVKHEQKSKRLVALESYFPKVQRDLRKKGVTRKLLWEEYKNQHPDGYMLSQFCMYYNRWSKRVSPTMHIEYKAGDRLLVDYAGKKLELIDRLSGEITEVEVFVAILGASQLIYVEASVSQKKVDFIKSCENALHYYGGVPKAIVTDNLKSAVIKSHRYEPRLNPDFEDFAEHYQMAVLPTRAYRPKDKALVEEAVRIVYQQIYARIRNEKFYSLDELNKAIRERLEHLNQRKLSGRNYCRREFFDQVESGVLSPLPELRFEIRNYIQATVLQNGHVSLREDKHYYSVPYKYIRNKVRIAYTSDKVKVYYKHQCIAEHRRNKSPFNYTTLPDHLASQHKQYTKWNATYFLTWASKIDPVVELIIRRILEKKPHPEQAYKSCAGILHLEKKVGRQRFIAACSLADTFEQYSYMALVNILDKGLDKLEESEENKPLPSHNNIRGKTYYTTNKTEENE